MSITAEIEIDTDEIVEQVIGSYSFDQAVEAAVDSALDNRLDGFDASEVLGKVEALTDRIATLEAVLATAGKVLAEPARRIIHGVEVSATTTGLF